MDNFYKEYIFTFARGGKILKYEIKEQTSTVAVLRFQMKFPSIEWFTVREVEIPFPYNLQD